MKISFLGSAKTVTGSCFYIETDSCSFIVDCGLFQGGSTIEAYNQEEFPFNPADLDYIVLTHAHIDHSGRIPKLFKDGFNGRIFATKATMELCEIMLPDSGHIQEFENEWINRKRSRAGLPPIEPLYTAQDAINCMKLFSSVRYKEIVELNRNVKLRFNDAGHILGSSIAEIWITEGGEETKLVFSGDLGNKNMPILRDPEIIESADYLFIESTYGNRTHMNVEKKTDKFLEIITSTIKKGGNVIIPSFAVGRTQELIYEINKHQDMYGDKIKELLEVPVYIDSPLAVSATKVFRNNPDCFDEEARAYIENGDNPLDFPNLIFTQSAEESKALNDSKKSKIIISASGMCDAGRIKHHLKHNLWRKESSVVFVGYQAEGTLGRRLIDGAKKVRIFGEEITVNARIEMIEGFSGHADRNGLLDWMSGFKIKPKKVFLIHGEASVLVEFANSIKNMFGLETIIPDLGDSYIIDSEGVFEADTRRDTVQKKEKYLFKRLEVVQMLDKLKDELDEASAIIRDDLKKETEDIKVDELLSKLYNFEKYILDIIK